jgi:hypothetical protein
MALIKKKFLENNSVDGSKIRLDNNQQLRARNAADDADVNVLRVDVNDRIVLASLPQAAGTPAVAEDLVNKAYLDASLQGLKPKEAVRVATTGPITLEDEQTIDGIAVVAGDRVLVKNQAAAEQNGIYVVVDGGAWTRAVDFDAPSEIAGAYTLVEQGTVAGKGFVVAQFSGVVGTDPINFVTFSSAVAYTAGAGLSLNGNEFDVNVDDATIEINTDALRVKDAGIGEAKLADNAVTTAKIANAAVDEAKLASSVAGNGLSGGAGTALAVNVDDATIEINTDALRVKDAGITAAKLASDVAGSGLASTAGVLSVKTHRQSLTLIADDITAGYVDLSQNLISGSIMLQVDGGPVQTFGVDYTVSVEGGVTRITFAGDLVGAAQLVVGDIIRVQGLIV